MSMLTCVGCTTRFAVGLDACPHCGGAEYVEEGVVVSRRLPSFTTVFCACGRGPWTIRLSGPLPGLVQLPDLFCASCGSQVQVPWPPVEDDVSPKITVHGGPSNAREQAESSPDAVASLPLAGAEAGQGHPTYVGEAGPETVPFATGGVLTQASKDAEPEPEPVEPDPYAGKTLAELREEADKRGVASYGSKAQIAERLRAADEAAKADGGE
jgi:rRNA maturation protein Nop10